MQAIQTMVDSTIQENCFVLPGTFKNSVTKGSALDYWPLQAEWPSQQDEIALGSSTCHMPPHAVFSKRKQLVTLCPSLAPKKTKSVRKADNGHGENLRIINF
jgi:hypothetical protein